MQSHTEEQALLSALTKQVDRLELELTEANKKIGQIYERLASDAVRQVCQIEELQAIVERVPKTGDGVPIYVGLTVWYYGFMGELRKSIVYEYNAYRCDETEVMTVSADKMAADKLYSTPEAAKAAKGES